MSKKVLLTILIIGVSININISTAATAVPGVLIKTKYSPSVYYLGEDNKRYVFPNEATFFSWYNDFSKVTTISPSEMASYPLGDNITIRPGTKLVKITTDPKVYAVESNGSLVWVPDETTASTLYGANWTQRVVDVPDAFFTNYTVSDEQVSATAYPEGSLVKWPDSADVYYIDSNSTARKIANEAAFTINSFKWDDIITAPDTLTKPTTSTGIASLETTLTNTASLSEEKIMDSDNDGLSDIREEKLGTDSTNPDTDGDGYLDGAEVQNGYNPNGPGKLKSLLLPDDSTLSPPADSTPTPSTPTPTPTPAPTPSTPSPSPTPPTDECQTNTDCDDSDSSTQDTCSGSPKVCANTSITECTNDDGYCPTGCTNENDNDCTPTDIDLDVVFIERAPRYERYDVNNVNHIPVGISNPGKKHPENGETVTFTAHIINKGTSNSGPFSYQWKLDNTVIDSGTVSYLTAENETTISYNWTWQNNGNYYIEFIADSNNDVSENYESNNSIKDRINALYYRFHVEQNVYNEFNSLINLAGTKSFEDWLQAHITEMNRMLSEGGTNERVRIDEIVIEPVGWNPSESEHAPLNLEWDGRWGFEPEEWTSSKINTWVNKIEGALLHEWTHQIGVIDTYNLSYDWNYYRDNEVIPICSSPTCAEGTDPTNNPSCQICVYYNPNLVGIMRDTNAIYYSEHSIKALESHLGQRRGYYGEYLFDIPTNNYLRIIKGGTPVVEAEINVYHGTKTAIKLTDNIFFGTTDANGKILLPNRSVSSIPTTETGHELKPNPFGDINVVGLNGILLIKISKGGDTDYQYINISEFNLQYWQGNTGTVVYDIETSIE